MQGLVVVDELGSWRCHVSIIVILRCGALGWGGSLLWTRGVVGCKL